MTEWSSPMNDSATAESTSAIFCGGMGCGAMAESSSATNDDLMVESSPAIFCNALPDSSSATNGCPMVEASPAIFCGAMEDSCSLTNDSPMVESSSLIKDIAVAESSSPIDDEVQRLFGREKTTHKVSGGAANILLWRVKKIWAGVFGGATAIWVLLLLLGYRILSLICHCLVTVIYLGPAATNFINKAFVILREINRGFVEINRGFAEINRCFAEIKRGFAEIKKGVAVLRRIMLGRHLRKFLIAFFLVCVCILYVSSPPHIREVSTPPQVVKISGGFKFDLGHVKEPPVL